MNAGAEPRTPAGSPVNAVRAIKKDEVGFAEPKAEEGIVDRPEAVQKVLFSALLPSIAQIEFDEILKRGLEFEFNDVALTKFGRETAASAAAVMVKHPKVGVKIVGYAGGALDIEDEDSHKPEKLSLLRARSVREIFLAAGCQNVIACKGEGQNIQKGARGEIILCDPQEATLIEAEVAVREDALVKTESDAKAMLEIAHAKLQLPKPTDEKVKTTAAMKRDHDNGGQVKKEKSKDIRKPTEERAGEVCAVALASFDVEEPKQQVVVNSAELSPSVAADAESSEEKPDRFFEGVVSFAGGAIEEPTVLQTIAAAVSMRPALQVRLVGCKDGDVELDAVIRFLGDLGVSCASSSFSEATSSRPRSRSGVRCQVLLDEDRELRGHFLRVGRRCGASVERSSPATLEIAEWLEASFRTRKLAGLEDGELPKDQEELDYGEQVLCVERELSGKLCTVTAHDDRPSGCVRFAARELDGGLRHELALSYSDLDDLVTSPKAQCCQDAFDIATECGIVSEQLELVHNDFCGTSLELRRPSVILTDEVTEETPKHEKDTALDDSVGEKAAQCEDLDTQMSVAHPAREEVKEYVASLQRRSCQKQSDRTP